MPRNKGKGKGLPQKQMITKINFQEEDKPLRVPCKANLALKGKGS